MVEHAAHTGAECHGQNITSHCLDPWKRRGAQKVRRHGTFVHRVCRPGEDGGRL